MKNKPTISKEQMEAMQNFWHSFDCLSVVRPKEPRRMTWFVLGLYAGLLYVLVVGLFLVNYDVIRFIYLG